MGDGPVWAVVGASIAGLFTLAVQKLRGQTDETVAVMGQWKALLDAHKQTADAEIATLKERISTIEKELVQVRDKASKDLIKVRDQASRDLAEQRKRHAAEREADQKKHEAEMAQMRALNEGLQRIVAQNSQSTAHLIGETPVTGALKRALPPPEDQE